MEKRIVAFSAIKKINIFRNFTASQSITIKSIIEVGQLEKLQQVG
jgi:hypothetical protein